MLAKIPRLFKWGILGSSVIASVCLIGAIKQSNNGLLTAVASRDLSRAKRLQGQYEIPKAYGSYQELIDDPEIDGIYIPLPNNLHYPWALKALDGGKHVLCEKPLALNAIEAREMMDKAKDSKLVLMEALMYRFQPRIKHIQKLVGAGVIGAPKIVRAAFTFHALDKENFRFMPEMGGGALLDVGGYCVSICRLMFQSEPIEVQAFSEIGETGVDLTTTAILKFPEGKMGVIECSFTSSLQQTVSVIGTSKSIELPHNTFIPWDENPYFTMRALDEEIGSPISIPGDDQYRLMVEHFANVCVSKEPLEITPQFSIGNMKVLDDISEAAGLHKLKIE
jgi:predicted dehydrogenase